MTFKPKDRIKVINSRRYTSIEVGDIGIVEDSHPSPGWYAVRMEKNPSIVKGLEYDDKDWELVERKKPSGIVCSLCDKDVPINTGANVNGRDLCESCFKKRNYGR